MATPNVIARGYDCSSKRKYRLHTLAPDGRVIVATVTISGPRYSCNLNRQMAPLPPDSYNSNR